MKIYYLDNFGGCAFKISEFLDFRLFGVNVWLFGQNKIKYLAEIKTA